MQSRFPGHSYIQFEMRERRGQLAPQHFSIAMLPKQKHLLALFGSFTPFSRQPTIGSRVSPSIVLPLDFAGFLGGNGVFSPATFCNCCSNDVSR